MQNARDGAPATAQSYAVYTVYLRASARSSDIPGHRTAICVVSPSGETHGELLDWPVLNRMVLARNVAEARARFLEWQALGHADAWLMTEPEAVPA